MHSRIKPSGRVIASPRNYQGYSLSYRESLHRTSVRYTRGCVQVEQYMKGQLSVHERDTIITRVIALYHNNNQNTFICTSFIHFPKIQKLEIIIQNRMLPLPITKGVYFFPNRSTVWNDCAAHEGLAFMGGIPSLHHWWHYMLMIKIYLFKVGYYSTSYKLIKVNYVTGIIKTKIYTVIQITSLQFSQFCKNKRHNLQG